MSSNTDTDDTTEQFDKATEKLSEEATQALDEIQQVIADAQNAATETADVAAPVVDILQELSQGDRAGAVQAAMVLFSDDTGKEISEARAACLAALAEAEQAAGEVDDVIDTLTKQAATIADSLAESDLADSLRSIF